MEIKLGPVRCHDCHAPGMVWSEGKWHERNWKWDRKAGAYVAVLTEHRCTARPGKPMYEFAR